jgi:hypothetical protein
MLSTIHQQENLQKQGLDLKGGKKEEKKRKATQNMGCFGRPNEGAATTKALEYEALTLKIEPDNHTDKTRKNKHHMRGKHT